MAAVEIKAMSPAEIHERLKSPDSAIQMHSDAIDKHGVRFGRYLEMLNPSEKGDTLDAFGRQLREAGIVTETDMYAGYHASEGKCFVDDVVGKSLYPEFFARQWQKVMRTSRAEQRAILLSTDSQIGGWDRPYADAMGPRWRNKIAPPIPLSELVAVTTPITGDTYRSIYMTYDAAAVRMFRVGESADIPVTTLVSAENTIDLHKYGRGIRATYEQLRRLRVDKIAWFIQWAALQAQIDKVAAVLDVMVNGDGNANTAATEYNLTTLDADATAGTLSLKGWLAFKLKFGEMYRLTTALMTEAVALQLITLNSGSGNVPLATFNPAGINLGLTPINNTGDGVRYGWTSEAPTGKIVGFDASMAIEHVTEIGSTIRETERYITNQTQLMTMTEVEGFAILDPGATKVLDVAE